MVNLKRILYFTVIGLLGMVSMNAQKNLLKNGDFKNGSTGWILKDFTLTEEDGRNCIVSPNKAAAMMMSVWPRVKTIQAVRIEAEKTYIFSFWAKGGLDYRDVNASLTLYTSSGSLIEDLDGEDMDDLYYDTNSMEFRESVDKGNGWVEIRREIKFPKEANIATLEGYRLNLVAGMGDGRRNMRITNISIAEKVDAKAPENFKVADNMLFQREAKLTWDAIEGKSYKVEVDNKTYEIAEGNNSIYVQGLMPNTKYTAVVYSETEPDLKSTLDFTTNNRLQEKEEDCVPFLANIEEGKLPKNFICNIGELVGGKVVKVEISYNGKPAVISEDGMVTLPDFDKGDLEVVITQENNEKTTLVYKSITVKK